MRLRVRVPYAVSVADRLTPREWEVLGTLRRCRAATGMQLQRLHFAELGGGAQVVRSRVLRRLAARRVIKAERRRVGGPGAGSASPVYLLDTVGATVLRMRTDPDAETSRAVRPAALPGDRFLAHLLAVTELYVQAVEADRSGRFRLAAFAAEPASWWTDPYERVLKPDAFLRVARIEPERVTDRWWVEVDLGTETIPTIAARLRQYAKFRASGATGPGGLVPDVLVATVDARRAATVRAHAIPATDTDMFAVADFPDAIDTIHTLLLADLAKT